MEHIGKKKGYRLGPTAFRLTNEIPYEQDLVNVARGVMEELTASINESSILGVLRNHKRYILHAVNAVQEIQVQLRSERNTYDTATGRLLLAYLSEKELERYIQHNGLPDAETWAEAQTMDNLTAELGAIKNAGIVHTHKQNRHVKGFAVPIFINEQVVASLSVFLPEYRCSDVRQKEITDRLKASAYTIGQKLSA
jgi:DNA-binding IclR family transcriptional regulator